AGSWFLLNTFMRIYIFTVGKAYGIVKFVGVLGFDSISIFSIIAWSIFSIFSDGEDQAFCLLALSCSIVFFVVGLAILYLHRFRDFIFGLNHCPRCKKKTINAKQMLKASWDRKNTHCKCPSCSTKLAVPYWALPCMIFAMFFAVFVPLFIAYYFD